MSWLHNVRGRASRPFVAMYVALALLLAAGKIIWSWNTGSAAVVCTALTSLFVLTGWGDKERQR